MKQKLKITSKKIIAYAIAIITIILGLCFFMKSLENSSFGADNQ